MQMLDGCALHRWPHTERASHAHTCRAEPNPAAHPRDRQVCASVARQHTRSQTDITRLCTDIHIYRTCAQLYLQADAHTQAVNGRIVRTRNRTHVHMEAMQPHARAYLYFHRGSYSYVYIYTYIYRTPLLLFIDGDIHARALMRAQTQRRTCASTAYMYPTVTRTADRLSMSACMQL